MDDLCHICRKSVVEQSELYSLPACSECDAPTPYKRPWWAFWRHQDGG